MSAETLVAIAELAAVVVGITAILVTLRAVRDQLWIQTFTEYTGRYAEIWDDLPSEARVPGSDFDLDVLPTAERGRLLNTVRGYLNLCSEEFWLYKKRKIDPETWGIWKVGIADNVRLPWFRSSWKELKSEYNSFPEDALHH
jgi:hypothetical protein